MTTNVQPIHARFREPENVPQDAILLNVSILAYNINF